MQPDAMQPKVKQPKGRHCPVTRALEVVGERWTLLIVRDLLTQGPCRFQSLLDSLDGISPNTLSARLKLLEETGVIGKADVPIQPAARRVCTDQAR